MGWQTMAYWPSSVHLWTLLKTLALWAAETKPGNLPLLLCLFHSQLLPASPTDRHTAAQAMDWSPLMEYRYALYPAGSYLRCFLDEEQRATIQRQRQCYRWGKWGVGRNLVSFIYCLQLAITRHQIVESQGLRDPANFIISCSCPSWESWGIRCHWSSELEW